MKYFGDVTVQLGTGQGKLSSQGIVVGLKHSMHRNTGGNQQTNINYYSA